jgi:ubiquitin thioesterase ZRANB1
MLDFSLDETQCAADWDNLLSVAGQPGSSLEQLHIFALAHIFRRPIIVYSVKFVKSYLGETLGYARYEGVYLPFLWDSSLCWKWPIALGYTRGHFSALVPQEPHCDPLMRASAAQLDGDGMNNRCTYLPLNTVDGNLLPIHFLSQAEVGNEEMILSQWLDLCYTNSGILVARQRIQKRPLLVAQLVEEWLNHYRTLGQMASTPYMRQSATTCYSSDGDSDND